MGHFTQIDVTLCRMIIYNKYPFVGRYKNYVPFCGNPIKGYNILYKGININFTLLQKGTLMWVSNTSIPTKGYIASYKGVYINVGRLVFTELYNFICMIDLIKKIKTL